jgi:hypothetical protein
MLYALYRLQIRGRICRGMSRSEDIEDSTKDPDVVWITRKIEQLDTSSLLGHIRTVCFEKFKVSNPTPVSSVTRPRCVQRTLVNTKGDRRNVPYDQPWRRQASNSTTPLRRCLRRAARYLCNAVIRVIYGLRPAMETQYPKDEKKSQSGLYGDYGGAQRKPNLLRSDVTTSCTQRSRRKIASRFRVHLQISLHLWHTDRQARHRLPPH